MKYSAEELLQTLSVKLQNIKGKAIRRHRLKRRKLHRRIRKLKRRTKCTTTLMYINRVSVKYLREHEGNENKRNRIAR